MPHASTASRWRIVAVIAALFGVTAAFADTLPLETGTYVLSSRPCVTAGRSAIYYYNGTSLTHASNRSCRAKIQSVSSETFTVQTACPISRAAVLRDRPSTEDIRFDSTQSFSRMGAGPRRSNLSYRLCQPDPMAIKRGGSPLGVMPRALGHGPRS